jgi:hypothetical protein
MIFMVDIDGTICANSDGDYANSVPYTDRITQINQLYDSGHTVIYWTARGMNSGKDHNELTHKQLSEWGCKCHEIRMRKPVYDVWIDDKAISLKEFFD